MNLRTVCLKYLSLNTTSFEGIQDGEKPFACEEERKYHSAKILTLYTVSTVNIKSVKDINHDCFS